VVGKGWVDAGALVVGDKLLAKDGSYLTVTKLGLVKKQVRVYNFEVAKLHTYFVGGEQQWLVHNQNQTCFGLLPAPIQQQPFGILPAPRTATEWCNTRGLVSGGHDLPVVTGHWLRGQRGNAGLIPKQIGDQLMGRHFDNFDDFREAFWMAIGNESNIANQFSPANRTRMLNGNAPFAVNSERRGGGSQAVYTLHHVLPIHLGGGVYDLDNLLIVTPQFHRHVLPSWYHYGT
jgi:Pretoxin HINT domain